MIFVISDTTENINNITDLCAKAAAENKAWILIDFYADWCRPCQTLGNFLIEADRNPALSHVFIAKINVDGKIGGTFASAFEVRSLPTLFLIKTSTPNVIKAKKIGAPQDLIKWIHESIQ